MGNKNKARESSLRMTWFISRFCVVAVTLTACDNDIFSGCSPLKMPFPIPESTTKQNKTKNTFTQQWIL